MRDHWHGLSRTGSLGRLYGHVSEPVVEMHPQDLARQKLVDGDLVRISSRRGSLVLPVQASAQVGLSQAFVAMHWGEEVLSGRGTGGERVSGINGLTTAAFCPRSKQPELKHSAVRIAPAELPWKLLALAWLPEGEALAVRERLRPLMAAFSFASCVPFGRERTGVMFRAAAPEAAPDQLLMQIEALLGLQAEGVLHYADRRRGQRRSMRLVGDADAQRLDGFLLAGDVRAECWVRPLLQDELSARALGRALLIPGAQAPVALAPRGRQVCSCFDVGEAAITACLDQHPGPPEARLARLQETTRCGTNCGSCVPELRRIIRLHRQAA